MGGTPRDVIRRAGKAQLLSMRHRHGERLWLVQGYRACKLLLRICNVIFRYNFDLHESSKHCWMISMKTANGKRIVAQMRSL